MNKLITILRRLKISYVLYNLFHKKQLVHNEAAYKSLGLKKKYYSSVCSEDFKQIKNSPSIVNDAGSIEQRLKCSNAFNRLNETNKTSLLAFSENGFAILKHYFSCEEADKINSEIDFY